jgi:Putative transposase
VNWLPGAYLKKGSAYLARYTHRVAIANSRLVRLNESGVTFHYKDYRRDGQARYRMMTFAAHEFIRCFLLHVLPRRFHTAWTQSGR